MRSPLQVHERRTVFLQPSAQLPNRSLLSNKELKSYWIFTVFVTTCTLTVLSALAIVRTERMCARLFQLLIFIIWFALVLLICALIENSLHTLRTIYAVANLT